MRTIAPRTKWLLALLILVSGWAAYATVTDHQMIQENRRFVVEEVTINVGDTLTFVNKDLVTHNVYLRDPKFSFSSKQTGGQSTTVAFPVEGDFELRCAIHPTMRLKVHVVRSGAPPPAAPPAPPPASP